jgi:hypothetical protein
MFKSKAAKKALYAKDSEYASSFEKKAKMKSRLPEKLKKKFNKKKLK